MKIFIVNKPFVDKTTRFGAPGKLVVGIAISALQANPEYGFKLGNGEIVYTGNSGELLAYAAGCNSIWTNPKGKKVAILPVELFKQQGALQTYDLPKRQPKTDAMRFTPTGGTV